MQAFKPGDVVKAKAIGTYPELPDAFDTYEADPTFWMEHIFVGDRHFVVSGGPKGVAVAHVDDHGLYCVVKDGKVLYEACVRYKCEEHVTMREVTPYLGA